MSERSSFGIFALVLALLAIYVYEPLVTMPTAGDDRSVAVAAHDLAWSDDFDPAALYAFPEGEQRPAAALSLAFTSFAFAQDTLWTRSTSRAARFENLLLLIVTAVGVAQLVRRALQPWTPFDQAKGAGLASGLLCVVHPLAAANVARIASRGDLLALAFGAIALAFFLKGRQERAVGRVVAAGVCAILAGFASPASVFLPPLAALLEFVSARRHRPRIVRFRTALNTLVVFALCVGLERLLRWGLDLEPGASFAFRAEGVLDPPGPRVGVAILGLEKLGVLTLPANIARIGTLGHGLAAVAILIGLQPAFVAARWAPRLWGWILLGWVTSVALAQIPDAMTRVDPQSLANADALLVAALVMSVGLGISSTALSGVRRYLLPIVVAILYAILSHSGGRARTDALAPSRVLRESLVASLREHGPEVDYVVVDPPRAPGGHDPIGNSLELWLEPAFLPGELVEQRKPSVRSLEGHVLRSWLRDDSFARSRANGLVLLVSRAWVEAHELTVDSEEPWVSLRLAAPAPSRGRMIWRGDGRSPSGVELDAWTSRALVATALPGTSTNGAASVRWSAGSRVAPSGGAEGVWVRTPNGPVARFDLGASWRWLLGERIVRLWTLDVLSSVANCQVFEEWNERPGSAPFAEGDDWFVPRDALELSSPPIEAQPELVLSLFDPGTLDGVTLVGERQAERVRFVGAEARVQAAAERGARALVWALEWRVGDVVIAQRYDALPVSPTTGRFELPLQPSSGD